MITLTTDEQSLLDKLGTDPDRFIAIRPVLEAEGDVHELKIVTAYAGGSYIKLVGREWDEELGTDPALEQALEGLVGKRVLASVGLHHGVGELYARMDTLQWQQWAEVILERALPHMRSGKTLTEAIHLAMAEHTEFLNRVVGNHRTSEAAVRLCSVAAYEGITGRAADVGEYRDTRPNAVAQLYGRTEGWTQ